MSFSDDINKLSDRYQRRMRATVQESTQRTAEIAQTVRGKGGRLRIDTGFLRSSFGAALNSPPVGPTDNPSGQSFPEGSSAGTGEPLVVILSKWQPGQDIFIGWSASYARAREAKDGFARGAAERWPDTVQRVAAEVRRKI